MRRLLVLLALGAAGCGSDRPSAPRVEVAAAQALDPALVVYARAFPGASVHFAAADALADRIRSDPRPDLVAGPMSTRTVLTRLSASQRAAIEGNVRRHASGSAALARLVAERHADAAFVYKTEARRWHGRLIPIDLSDKLVPRVRYGIAVVRGAAHPDAARAFVAGLGRAAGRHALTAAGFATAPFRPR